MFYTAELFKRELGYLTDDQANHVARVANEIINQLGTVIYGRALDDGTLHDFSTNKNPSDMTVAIAIGAKEMGIFKEDESTTRRDMPNVVSAKSKDDYIAKLEREIKSTRGVISRRPGKVGPS